MMTATEDNSQPSPAPATAGDALEGVITPVLDALGYEFVHLEWAASGRHRRLQVFIDHPDGFGLADCTRLSPILSNALDAAEADPTMPQVAAILAQPYVLEVSSPGLDRPLARRSHFARFVGRRATVRTTEPVVPDSNQKTFHGRIVSAQADPDAPHDDRTGTIELLADDGLNHRIPLALVRRANLVYED